MENDSQHLSKAAEHFSRAGAAFSEFAEALVSGVVEVVSYLADGFIDFSSVCLTVGEVKEAIDNAPPKLRHYAIYAKRYRIRKKYLDRILKEYQEKKEG